MSSLVGVLLDLDRLDPKVQQPRKAREDAALKNHVKGSAGLVTRFKPP